MNGANSCKTQRFKTYIFLCIFKKPQEKNYSQNMYKNKKACFGKEKNKNYLMMIKKYIKNLLTIRCFSWKTMRMLRHYLYCASSIYLCLVEVRHCVKYTTIRVHYKERIFGSLFIQEYTSIRAYFTQCDVNCFDSDIKIHNVVNIVIYDIRCQRNGALNIEFKNELRNKF